MDLSAEELAAASKAYADGKQGLQQVSTPEPVTTTSAASEPPAQTAPVTTPSEPAAVAEAAPETIAAEVSEASTTTAAPEETPTFEKYLEEKSGGRFKSYDDIEKLVNAPKEELDEEIRHFAELKKKGVKFDAEFFELQSKDFSKMDDPIVLRLEALRRKPEGRGLSEETLAIELHKKYNIREWIDKPEDELTEEDIANREILYRDAREDRDWLTSYRSERLLVKQPNEEDQRRVDDSKLAAKAKWESYVDNDLVAKVTNISVPVEVDKDGKTVQAFDYKISEADRKDIGNTMKAIGENVMHLFDRFALKDDKGQILRHPNGDPKVDNTKIFLMLAKEKAYESAIKNAWNDAAAIGEKKGISSIKNTNFSSPESAANTTSDAPKTETEAMRKAMAEKGVKFI